MNTLPRVTKGHHWRPLNALRFPSTRLLTPSSTVFQPIFPLSRTQIRVNGCNYPYPTAYCFLLFSSPDEWSWRKERRNILAPSIYIRIINEPWKYPTLDSCFSRRNLLLFVYPLVESWWREVGGEKEEGGEKKRWLPSENRPRSPVGTDSSGDTSLQRFVSKMKLNFFALCAVAKGLLLRDLKHRGANIDTTTDQKVRQWDKSLLKVGNENLFKKFPEFQNNNTVN